MGQQSLNSDESPTKRRPCLAWEGFLTKRKLAEYFDKVIKPLARFFYLLFIT